MRALVDADFLVALAKEDDSNHQKALVKVAELKDATIFITPFTVSEAVTVLSYKVSQNAARALLTSLRQKNFIELPMDKATIEKADKIFFTKRLVFPTCFEAALFWALVQKLRDYLGIDARAPKYV